MPNQRERVDDGAYPNVAALDALAGRRYCHVTRLDGFAHALLILCVLDFVVQSSQVPLRLLLP